jgi:hypothetical protein
MYRMGGDTELHDFVLEAQHLLAVEQPEGLVDEEPTVEDVDSSLHSFSDVPTECLEVPAEPCFKSWGCS